MAGKALWAAATVLIVVLTVGALIYYYGRIPSPVPDVGQLQTPRDQADLNWAGYSAAYNFSDPKPLVTGVSGSWIVPQIQISQNDTYSAIWVGIGGFFGGTLIQVGTEQDCIGGVVQYSAWYELLPSDSITIAMEVRPRDEINASISLQNAILNLWWIKISDLSTGQSFSQLVYYSSTKLSAEWVVERPEVNNTLGEIANFGNVTLSNCNATIDDEVGAFGHFPSIRLFMYDRSGTRLANVSKYGDDGSSFTVQYIRSQ